MMPKGKFDPASREPASRQFTDREGYLEAFDEALGSLDRAHHSALVYYGVGGIGKTALLQELERRLDDEKVVGSLDVGGRDVPLAAPEVAHAKLNFEESAYHRPAPALMRLHELLQKNYRISFPSFEIAYSLYWGLSHPGQPLKQSELTFLKEGEIAAELVGLLQDTPLVGWAAKIPSVLHKVTDAGKRWWTKRGQAELRALVELRDPEPQAVAERLPYFWSRDVLAWLEEDGERELVIFLDTYEALWQGQSEGQRGLPPDEWVRDWASYLPGVLWVVAGRQKLQWEEQDPDWKGLVEQHLVGDLAPEDCHRFLESAGVAEADVREMIVSQSEGLPFYLDLAVDTYDQIVRSEGRAPRPAEFDANLEGLLSRFLAYTSDEQKAALNVLSVPRTFDLELYGALMTAFSTGYSAMSDGLIRLRQYSFMAEPTEGRYSLHDLLRAALAEKQEREAPGERERIHRFLFDRAKAQLKDVDPKAVTETERQALEEAVDHGQRVLEPEEYLEWYWEAQEPFVGAAEWSLLLPLHQRTLEVGERELGEGHPDTLEATNNLALLLHKHGRYAEAETLFRRALEARERVLGEEHPDTLGSVNDFALLLTSQGRYEEAELFSRRALEGAERVLGEDHLDTLTSVNTLALLLASQGRYEEAEKLYRRALGGCERLLGEENPSTLTSVNNLASLLKKKGHYDEAESLFRRTLEARSRVLGEEHPSTLVTVGSLASLLSSRGRYEEAEPLHRRALGSMERVLGEDHPDTLTSGNNLALLLVSRGRYEEAEPLFRLVLEAQERVLGEEHPHTLTSMNNLAAILMNQDRYKEAERLFRLVLQARGRVLGEEHPHTLTSVNNLAAILMNQDRYKEAERLFRLVLQARERVLGEEHPDTLSSAHVLGTLLATRDRYDEAESLYRRAMEARERVLGEEHPDTLRSLESLATVLEARGSLDEAERLRDRV